MNLHEYQGKSILKKHNVKIQEGFIATTPGEAKEIAGRLKSEYNSDFCVIKAQIHAGGRGKGGGVKLARTLEEVNLHASKILGMNLVTKQTGPSGKTVNTIFIQEGCKIKKEFL